MYASPTLFILDSGYKGIHGLVFFFGEVGSVSVEVLVNHARHQYIGNQDVSYDKCEWDEDKKPEAMLLDKIHIHV